MTKSDETGSKEGAKKLQYSYSMDASVKRSIPVVEAEDEVSYVS
jgi:hypothetical protein